MGNVVNIKKGWHGLHPVVRYFRVNGEMLSITLAPNQAILSDTLSAFRHCEVMSEMMAMRMVFERFGWGRIERLGEPNKWWISTLEAAA